MQTEKIRAIIKNPGELAYMTVIENNLEKLQEIVGGYIETVTITNDICIVCNEEGRIKKLAENCKILGVDFVGTIIFIGTNDDEFANLPISYSSFRDLFPELWEG